MLMLVPCSRQALEVEDLGMHTSTTVCCNSRDRSSSKLDALELSLPGSFVANNDCQWKSEATRPAIRPGAEVATIGRRQRLRFRASY